MYTQCRGCGEVFVIEVEHLTHARGQVRCNLCGTVFDGMETLSATKPHEDEDLLLHEFDNAPPLLTQAYHTLQVADAVEEGLEGDLTVVDEGDLEAELDEIIADAQMNDSQLDEEALPSFVAEDDNLSGPFVAEKKVQPENKSSSWLFSALAVAMLIGLFWQAQAAISKGQLVLPEHPMSEKLCEFINCAQNKVAVDLNAISLVSRNIRPHPGRDEALIISASMINANEANQQFPALEIKLSDLNGQIVAMRRFIADEYVPADVLRAGFLPNTLIPINLEIVSPGQDAVAFEIRFVQP
ncbi:zinc-ribbon and DUF3426 domain-containing protein [Marinicella sp. S1101]|uniref:zinc-ribbon and DUF3426 domain-containing protein n=1 Tax=Marinicella marina TaxID=2996016 RepID=UPI002260CA7E|nr:zinc-ribbon and DUF3426 domain-containing protein [Marinicella marina]MCX7552889.1 zinc-ribbon and DUF3426 domain-containing protein [Marinicella marina]MDJ1139802.1 zinc-ribbon and DUF3426 domain-containing protein [Marinicella marina]